MSSPSISFPAVGLQISTFFNHTTAVLNENSDACCQPLMIWLLLLYASYLHPLAGCFDARMSANRVADAQCRVPLRVLTNRCHYKGIASLI